MSWRGTLSAITRAVTGRTNNSKGSPAMNPYHPMSSKQHSNIPLTLDSALEADADCKLQIRPSIFSDDDRNLYFEQRKKSIEPICFHDIPYDIPIYVVVVGFHHAEGPCVENIFPELPSFSHEIPHNVNFPPNPNPNCDVTFNSWALDVASCLPMLPFTALPDSGHKRPHDLIFFSLPTFSGHALHGVACYQSILSSELNYVDKDMTRGGVQKSICILTPFSDDLTSLLQPLVDASIKLFHQKDFRDLSIVLELQMNLQALLLKKRIQLQNRHLTQSIINYDDTFEENVISAHYALAAAASTYHAGVKSLTQGPITMATLLRGLGEEGIIEVSKALIAGRKVLVLGDTACNVSLAVIQLLSLLPHPHQLLGTPLEVWRDIIIAPHAAIQLIPMLKQTQQSTVAQEHNNTEKRKKGYLVGSTNLIFKQLKDINPDIIIELTSTVAVTHGNISTLNSEIVSGAASNSPNQRSLPNFSPRSNHDSNVKASKEDTEHFKIKWHVLSDPFCTSADLSSNSRDSLLSQLIHHPQHQLKLNRIKLDSDGMSSANIKNSPIEDDGIPSAFADPLDWWLEGNNNNSTSNVNFDEFNPEVLDKEYPNNCHNLEENEVSEKITNSKSGSIQRSASTQLRTVEMLRLALHERYESLLITAAIAAGFLRSASSFRRCLARDSPAASCPKCPSPPCACSSMNSFLSPEASRAFLARGTAFLKDWSDTENFSLWLSRHKLPLLQAFPSTTPLCGFGRFTYANGDCYVGSFRNGCREGKGLGWEAEGRLEFEGDWKNDKRHGYGCMIGPGSHYEGSWYEGEMHGEGSLRMSSGERYTGQFLNGLFDGSGVLIDADGGVYEGEWVGGEKSGIGRESFAQGAQKMGNPFDAKVRFDGWEALHFAGEFAHGQRQGVGQASRRIEAGLRENSLLFLASKGDALWTYGGPFESNLASGHGRLRMCKVEFEGEFAEGRRHGHGTLTCPQSVLHFLKNKDIVHDSTTDQKSPPSPFQNNDDDKSPGSSDNVTVEGLWMEDKPCLMGGLCNDWIVTFPLSSSLKYSGGLISIPHPHMRGIGPEKKLIVPHGNNCLFKTKNSTFNGEFSYGKMSGLAELVTVGGWSLTGRWCEGVLADGFVRVGVPNRPQGVIVEVKDGLSEQVVGGGMNLDTLRRELEEGGVGTYEMKRFLIFEKETEIEDVCLGAFIRWPLDEIPLWNSIDPPQIEIDFSNKNISQSDMEISL